MLRAADQGLVLGERFGIHVCAGLQVLDIDFGFSLSLDYAMGAKKAILHVFSLLLLIRLVHGAVRVDR